jgi:hypothetical protein
LAPFATITGTYQLLPRTHLDGLEVEAMDLSGFECVQIESLDDQFALDAVALRGRDGDRDCAEQEHEQKGRETHGGYSRVGG